MIGVQAQKDVTSQYITNATLSDGTNGWTKTHTKTKTTSDPADAFSNSVQGNNTVGYATEAYAGWGELIQTAYSMKQTITLPAGNYRLVCYAFYRQGNAYNTNPSKSLAYLRAGSQMVSIKTLGSVTGAAGYANSQAEGANVFDSKMYRNYVDFTVDEDNSEVPIGVEGTFDEAKCWCIVGSFELLDLDQDAAENNPVNYTYFINNPGYECRNASGWTIAGDAGGYANGAAFSPKAGIGFVEKWSWVATANYNGSCLQTVTVPAGKYQLKAYAHNIKQQQGDAPGSGMYLVANDDQVEVGATGQYTVNTKVTTGQLTLGMKMENATGNWLAYDRFELYYLGVDLDDLRTALQARVDVAKGLLTNKIAATELSDLNAQIEAYDGKASELMTKKALDEATAAVNNAIDNANISTAAYATLNSAMTAYAAKVATLDSDGQAAYDVTAIQTAYDNVTYSTSEALAAVNDVDAAYKVAIKGQTSADSNWTDLITNPSFEDNAAGYEEPIGWTLAGTANGIQTQNNSGFDGYKVGAMFGERWSNSTIGDFDAYQTIEGMPSGVYELKAVATFNGTGGYLYANDIKTNVTEAKYYTVQVALDANSTLRVGVKNETSGNGSWFKCDDFTLTLVSAGLPNVTPVVGKMNAEVAAAQTTAIETYEANRTVANYNAASAAVAAAQASVDAYAAANAAIVKAEGIIAETNVFVATNKTAYQDAINTAKSAYNAGSMEDATATSLENNLNGGTAYKHEGDPMRPFYSGAWSATNEVSIYTNNWSVEGNTDGSNFTTPFIEDWVADANSLANTTISASVTNLPTGTYNVTARVRMRLKNNGEAPVNGLSLQASSGEPVAVSGTPNYGSFYVSEVAATGYVTEEGGSLGINFIVNNTNASWLSIKAVNYERTGDLPAADAADYAALKDALDAVAGNVVGFEAGEYAPYNNKEAVAALNVAKAIDPTVTNVKFAVQAATAALTDATWTANIAEVNAFYKGDFADYAEDTSTPLDYTPNGWTATNNFRLMLKNVETYPGLADASAGTAPMSWSGGITYGETAGYEMPLKANTIYRLQFKAAGWNNETRSGMSVSILNGTDGMALYNLGTPDRDIKGNGTNVAGMTSYDVVFATGAAGNYVFHIQSGNNFVVTDFNLVKAASQTLTITDGEALPKFAPGTYPSATYTRTISAESKYGTICLPFNVKSDENITFYSLKSVEGKTLNLTSADEGVAAGVPAVFKKLTADATEISVTTANAEVVAAPVAQVGDTKLVGTFSDINVSENVEKCYYIMSNAFWQGNGNFNVKAYRAYIEDLTATNPGARLVINVDGEDPTAINVIEAAEAEEGTQKDGKYLIDGKVIIVKNGVKYGANGQKLN